MHRNHPCPRRAEYWLLMAIAAILAGCGYSFSGGMGDSPYPPDIKTIVLESALNGTTVTGIETELTNDLRKEFALGTRLTAVTSGGDVNLKTVISSYEDTPSSYKADGKELTRIGTLKISCVLEKSDSKKTLWQKDFYRVSHL